MVQTTERIKRVPNPGALWVKVDDMRPIQLPRAVTETLDYLRFAGETWEEFIWRTILAPRGYIRMLGEPNGGEE